MNYQVNAYFNLDRRGAAFDGYAGQPLIASGLGVMDIEARSIHEAAETVFRNLNMDSRPNGRSEPSLSVGDVVLVADAAGVRCWLPIASSSHGMLDQAPRAIHAPAPFDEWPIIRS